MGAEETLFPSQKSGQLEMSGVVRFLHAKAVPQQQFMMNLSQKDYGKDVRILGLALTLLGEWAFPNMP